MTGVEILAMEEVAASYAYNWTWFWITICVSLGIVLMIGLASCAASGDWEELMMFVFFGALLGVILGLLSVAIFSEPSEYETQYKVTISDEVSVNDFLERYEIIDQEGKIYTVRERNDES